MVWGFHPITGFQRGLVFAPGDSSPPALVNSCLLSITLLPLLPYFSAWLFCHPLWLKGLIWLQGQGSLVYRALKSMGSKRVGHDLATEQSETVSPLQTDLQVASSQTFEHASHHQAWVKLQPALHLPLLTVLQLSHLPPPLPAPASGSSCLFTWWCQPLCVSCYALWVLFKVLDRKIKNVVLFCVFYVLFVWKLW